MEFAEVRLEPFIALIPPFEPEKEFDRGRVEPVADELGGDAADDGVGGDVAGDDGAGADDRAIADRDAAADDGGSADPDVVADGDGGVFGEVVAVGEAGVEAAAGGIEGG